LKTRWGEGERYKDFIKVGGVHPLLVGEGRSSERSSFETGEGFVSADRDPSSVLASHKGRREDAANPSFMRFL
jgi:hypothetical protein